VARAAALLQAATRPLSPAECLLLTSFGNSGAFLVPRAAPPLGRQELSRITQCEFVGEDNVVEPGARLSRSRLEASYVGADCSVQDCARVGKCVVMNGSRLAGCGVVSCGPTSSAFGNDAVDVSPGPEVGGRNVACTVHASLEACARVALDRTDAVGQALFSRASRAFAAQARFSHCVLAAGSVVAASPLVRARALVGATVDAGGIVVDSTLLAGSHVSSHGLCVSSLLQCGARVDSHGVARGSLLCEGAHVELHGKALRSVLGPGAHVAEGEVSSSLVGPGVGMHHQSLLIACFWPSGRGNVGYGANVGACCATGADGLTRQAPTTRRAPRTRACGRARAFSSGWAPRASSR
jgi:hypothetical protein